MNIYGLLKYLKYNLIIVYQKYLKADQMNNACTAHDKSHRESLPAH